MAQALCDIRRTRAYKCASGFERQEMLAFAEAMICTQGGAMVNRMPVRERPRTPPKL
jgi:hypothetical protein